MKSPIAAAHHYLKYNIIDFDFKVLVYTIAKKGWIISLKKLKFIFLLEKKKKIFCR